VPAHDQSPLTGASGRLRRSRRMGRDARRTGLAPAEPRDPSATPDHPVTTTLDATIRPVGTGRYRRLDWAPGEPHLVRDDLGVRAGFARAYGRPVTPKELLAHGEIWRPFRSVATWYLWRILEEK